MRTARLLIDLGLAAKGYAYVNVDDCWQVGRDAAGDIVADPARFPGGMKAVADAVHALGMKYGLYTASHEFTCQGRPGSYLHETRDADAYCDFGVDYVKIDACGGRGYAKKDRRKSWQLFRDAFDACHARTGRAVVESVESCGTVDECGAWVGDVAHLWRTTNDIQNNWASVLANADATERLWSLAGPGHWNDPDMLLVGNVGLDADEARAHFSIWCMLAAPLLIGTDLHALSAENLAILGNEHLIAIDQDPLGFQGRKVVRGAREVWMKQLANGDVAVMLLNRDARAARISAKLDAVGLAAGRRYAVFDCWRGKAAGTAAGSYAADVPSHGAVVARLSPDTAGKEPAKSGGLLKGLLAG